MKQLTNTEYMSSRDTLDYVMKKFTNMTIKDFEAFSPDGMELIDGVIVEMNDLSEKKMQDMTYIEFAFLLHNVGKNTDYTTLEYSRVIQMQIYFILARVMLDGNKQSIPIIRMFLAVPLKAFYEYMISLSGRRRGELRQEYYYMKKNFRNNSDYTIQDYIEAQVSESKSSWNLTTSLEEYGKRIEAAHKAMGRLLVRSFYLAFADEYSADDICRKYQLRDDEACEYEEEIHQESNSYETEE